MDQLNLQQEGLSGGSIAPLDPGSRLEITNYGFAAASGERQVSLIWTSRSACRYRIEETEVLGSPWRNVLDNIVPDAGATTTRSIVRPSANQRFYRIRATRLAAS